MIPWVSELQKEWIIFILAAGYIIVTVLAIRWRRAWRTEQRRRCVPLLEVFIDESSGQLVLKNTGDCAAKDIRIDDFSVDVLTDFKKSLTLKFGDVAWVQPRELAVPQMHIFDGTYDMTTKAGETIATHLRNTAFDMILHYANLENCVFEARIVKDNGGFHIHEVVDQAAK